MGGRHNRQFFVCCCRSPPSCLLPEYTTPKIAGIITGLTNQLKQFCHTLIYSLKHFNLIGRTVVGTFQEPLISTPLLHPTANRCLNNTDVLLTNYGDHLPTSFWRGTSNKWPMARLVGKSESSKQTDSRRIVNVRSRPRTPEPLPLFIINGTMAIIIIIDIFNIDENTC